MQTSQTKRVRNKTQNQPSAAPGPNAENEQRIIEHIRKLAYELWEADGYHQGNDMANWLKAERQVRAQVDRVRSRAA